MDSETIKRIKGDFNQTSITKKMNSLISQDKQVTNQSYLLNQDQTERTFSLTILFNNIIDLNLKEIIALYDQIDRKIFDHELRNAMILAERSQFDDVSQLENQRIVLHQYKKTLVVAGYIRETQQLSVLKQIIVDNQETFIQYLDEYRIHYKINQLFPQQSLQMIVPVKIEKSQNNYEIAACMERAQFNLFDYSRNQKIGDDEAMNIFVQILDQIINLHSVNIAHRDIKPQNIFYVKEKGWLVSDFGESLEYEDVDGFYNIRGTKYFLMPALQLSINKNSKVNQNLITNDTYALVVSMIMIKNQQYIYDMQEQIENLKDNLLSKAISLKNLTELLQFREEIRFVVNKDFINSNISCQKQMNAEEQRINNRCNFLSQMQYYQHQITNNSDPIWQQKILQLIKRNLRYILQQFNSTQGYMIINLSLFLKVDLQLQLSRNWIKNIQNKQLKQQEFQIEVLFIYGYTERTIQMANQYLQTNYTQTVHLVLIDAYYRANMIQEAEQQLQQFHEGMVFDQLNTNLQSKYLQYLQYLYGEQLKYNVYFDFNIEQELIDRGHQKCDLSMNEFYDEQQQLSIEPYINREKIVDSIVRRIDIMCLDFSVLNLYFCKEVLKHTLNQPIYILLSLLQKIYQQNYQQFDSNKKITFLQQIAEITILLNQRKDYLQNLKLIKQSSVLSESWEQTISFKILYQAIFFMEYEFQQNNCKFNINLHFRKFINELRKINKIKFKCYLQYILGNLLNLIKIIQLYQIQLKSKYIVYVIQFIINLAFKYNFHITNYDDYQLFHIQAQCILIDVKNDNRSQILVKSQRKFLNIKAQQVIEQKKLDPLNLLIRPSIKKLLRIQVLGTQQINQIVKREFIFNRYFE